MMDRRLLQRLRSERGTTLIEVIAAAIILVVIAGAITSLVSAAQRESGQAKVIAIAGDLAQTQLEDLRSKKFAQLVAMNETATVTAGGMSFTVKRESTWASEASTEPVGCSSTANTPEALQVKVSVEWPEMRRPVELDTLVAAPVSEENTGNFVVQVNDRDAEGVPGVQATMTGSSQTATGQTDDTGCVRFTALQQGPYTLTLTKTGFVDRKHNSPIVDNTITVSGGETGNKTFEYDQGGGVHVGFYKDNGATYTAVPVTGAWLKAAGVDSVQPTLSAGNTIAREPRRLWPSASPYELHADTCETATAVKTVPVARGVFPAAPPATLPPATAQHVIMPQVYATVNGVPPGVESTIRVRITTACGTVIPEFGMAATGGYLNGTWTSAKVVVPPGVLSQVCLYGKYGNGNNSWYWKREIGTHTVTASAADQDPGKRIEYTNLNGLSGPGNLAAVCNS